MATKYVWTGPRRVTFPGLVIEPMQPIDVTEKVAPIVAPLIYGSPRRFMTIDALKEHIEKRAGAGTMATLLGYAGFEAVTSGDKEERKAALKKSLLLVLDGKDPSPEPPKISKTEARRAIVAEMAEAGSPVADIAEAVGVTEATIKRDLEAVSGE